MTTELKTGSFKSFDDTEIYYEIRGEGKPIVLIYGIGCLINHWRHQIKYFSEKYQVIAFDLRGHQKSSIPSSDANLTMEALAKDINLLLKHLNIQKASLWGHSFGVPIIFKTYEMHPEIFDNMVLVNGFANNPFKQNALGIDFVTPIFEFLRDKYTAIPDLWSQIWKASINNPLAIQLSAILGGFNLKVTSLKDVEIYARGVAGMNPQVFLTLFKELLQYNAEEALDKIEVPTLIIGGDKDMITPQILQKNIHNAIPKSEYLCIPYGSHCTQLDFPEFLNLRAEKFLNENKK